MGIISNFTCKVHFPVDLMFASFVELRGKGEREIWIIGHPFFSSCLLLKIKVIMASNNHFCGLRHAFTFVHKVLRKTLGAVIFVDNTALFLYDRK